MPRAWVQEAIREEVDYFNKSVWTAIPLDVAMQESDAKIVGSRLVICNTNDHSDPDVRARLVAQEISSHADTSFFAANPPLEAKRLLLSQFATERRRGGQH